MIENIQRRDLSVIEEAEGYQALLDKHGYSQQELADIVGKSRSHIANSGRLLSLPQKIRDHLINRRLSMGQVRPLIGRDDAEQLAEKIIKDQLSARQVEGLIKSLRQKPSQSGKPPEKSSDIRALEIRARTELGLAMRLDWDERREKGQLVLKVTSLNSLKICCRRSVCPITAKVNHLFRLRLRRTRPSRVCPVRVAGSAEPADLISISVSIRRSTTSASCFAVHFKLSRDNRFDFECRGGLITDTAEAEVCRHLQPAARPAYL